MFAGLTAQQHLRSLAKVPGLASRGSGDADYPLPRHQGPRDCATGQLLLIGLLIVFSLKRRIKKKTKDLIILVFRHK